MQRLPHLLAGGAEGGGPGPGRAPGTEGHSTEWTGVAGSTWLSLLPALNPEVPRHLHRKFTCESGRVGQAWIWKGSPGHQRWGPSRGSHILKRKPASEHGVPGSFPSTCQTCKDLASILTLTLLRELCRASSLGPPPPPHPLLQSAKRPFSSPHWGVAGAAGGTEQVPNPHATPSPAETGRRQLKPSLEERAPAGTRVRATLLARRRARAPQLAIPSASRAGLWPLAPPGAAGLRTPEGAREAGAGSGAWGSGGAAAGRPPRGPHGRGALQPGEGC